MNTAEAILMVVRIWLSIGAVVAAVFLTIGIDRIDEDARGAYIFRPLLVPAVLLIWPIILRRWWVLEAGRDDWAARHDPPRKAHLVVSVLMAVGLIGVLWTGVSVRQTWPADVAPVQLTEAAQ